MLIVKLNFGPGCLPSTLPAGSVSVKLFVLLASKSRSCFVISNIFTEYSSSMTAACRDLKRGKSHPNKVMAVALTEHGVTCSSWLCSPCLLHKIATGFLGIDFSALQVWPRLCLASQSQILCNRAGPLSCNYSVIKELHTLPELMKQKKSDKSI